ncbi:hypothetical protein [Actinocatenispora comari]|uniref:Uncharacterized protein n=1 Tax=Actinocatenispora comari TaxID=2807577 RepID=A0A8J4EQK9_9ACTN|nr:hypothetical protein [Actinocatenispora comari]GIL29934.1 hypothetical protein NUM_51880 [Actinocatenispora comari]
MTASASAESDIGEVAAAVAALSAAVDHLGAAIRDLTGMTEEAP